MAEHRGGSGNFAENREKHLKRAAKGGQHSGERNFKTIRNELLKPVKGGQNSHGGRKIR